MTAPAPAPDPAALVADLGGRARAATRRLAVSTLAQRNRALAAAAAALRAEAAAILAANAADCAELGEDRDAAFRDRLRLDPARVEAMAGALEAIAALPDPLGRVLDRRTRPNGLVIERVAVPIGVIAMIFEARPNVAADAGALCLKAGNAVILRGGSESRRSVAAITAALRAGLAAAGLPEDAVLAVPSGERALVGALLGATGHIDLAIPRGGRGLVELVRDAARVPVLLHLDGNCHSYIHESADLARALPVVRDAKLRRPGICGATESLLVDRALAAAAIPALADTLGPGCELRGDAEACALDPRLVPAAAADWDREYLAPIASVKVVAGLDEAIAWVNAHGSHHTDAILTEDDAAAARFLAEVDSAIVMHNASTQFADGGEFGMGAEIGIATGRLHARGPVGLEQLTTMQYRVLGTGQVRG